MTQFDEGHQPEHENRKPRGRGKKALMLEAVREVCETGEETEFLQNVVKAAIGNHLADPPIPPNAQLMTLVLQRIEPALKPVAQLIKVGIPESGTPAEKAISVVDSIANGDLPVDVGQILIGIIKDALLIEESTDLKERIEKLEEMING